MSGQSVVHTGSRKVSSTTLPRRLASETCWPSWLVSVKLGRGLCRAGPWRRRWPAAMIGSALRFAEANGHRRRADQDHAERAEPGDRPRGPRRTPDRAVASHAGSRARPLPERRATAVRVARRPRPGCRGRPGCGAGAAPRYPAVNSRISGIMLFGSVPSPPKKPRSSISTQSARQNTAPAITAIRASRASPRAALSAERRAEHGERDDRDQVHREPVRGGEVAERRRRSPSSTCGCDVPAIDWTMPASEPGWPSARALPEAAPRPGLEQRHAEEERARPAEDAAGRSAAVSQARSGSAISAPGHRVDEHRARRAEQHGQPGREDPAERLAERPDDQPPRHAGQPGEPGRPAAHREDQPHADADLDPHGRRGRPGPGGRPRWSRPSSPGAAPRPGEVAAVGLITWSAGRPPSAAAPARSRRTPTGSPKPTRSSRRARGSCHGRTGAPGAAAPRSAGPGPRRAPRHQQQHEDERDDDPLMQQRGPEGGRRSWDRRGSAPSSCQARRNPSPAIIVRLSLPQVT